MSGPSPTSEPCVTEVERGAVRKFAEALGETARVHFDVAAAHQAGYRDLLAPPTFAITLPAAPVPGVELPASGNLHGEQDFDFSGAIYARDSVSVVRRLVGVKEREGRSGKLEIYTFENVGTNQVKEIVFTARQVIIVRRTQKEA